VNTVVRFRPDKAACESQNASTRPVGLRKVACRLITRSTNPAAWKITLFCDLLILRKAMCRLSSPPPPPHAVQGGVARGSRHVEHSAATEPRRLSDASQELVTRRDPTQYAGSGRTRRDRLRSRFDVGAAHARCRPWPAFIQNRVPLPTTEEGNGFDPPRLARHSAIEWARAGWARASK